MERPFANIHDSDQSPFETDSGSSRRPNLSIAAGHIVTRGESANRPVRKHVKGAEALIAAALGQPEAPAEDHNTQYSSWHRMEMDEEGKVIPVSEQHYGKEFYAQASVEQNDPGATTYQVPIPTAPTQPIVPVSSSPEPSITAQSQYVQPVIPQPYTQSSVQPMAPVTPSQHPAFTNPVTVPVAQPVAQEPRLAPGASIDAQHRLPAPHPVKRFVQSPWTWLIIGSAMIIYFLV